MGAGCLRRCERRHHCYTVGVNSDGIVGVNLPPYGIILCYCIGGGRATVTPHEATPGYPDELTEGRVAQLGKDLNNEDMNRIGSNIRILLRRASG